MIIWWVQQKLISFVAPASSGRIRNQQLNELVRLEKQDPPALSGARNLSLERGFGLPKNPSQKESIQKVRRRSITHATKSLWSKLSSEIVLLSIFFQNLLSGQYSVILCYF